MIQALKDTLVELAGSKKFLILLATLLTAGCARFGLNVSPDAIVPYLGLAATAILAQGIADHGKSAAEVRAAVLGAGFSSFAVAPATTAPSVAPPVPNGFVRLALMGSISIGLMAGSAIVVLVNGCSASQKAAATQLGGCTEDAAGKALLPAVKEALANDSFDALLSSLATGFGLPEVNCVVAFAENELKTLAAKRVGGETEYDAAIAHADSWLKGHSK